jgi:hypothetical protein
MLRVVKLNVANKPFVLSVVMLCVIMLSLIMLSVFMLNVMAPQNIPFFYKLFLFYDCKYFDTIAVSSNFFSS